jgi:hypothetical protein
VDVEAGKFQVMHDADVEAGKFQVMHQAYHPLIPRLTDNGPNFILMALLSLPN